MKNKKGFTLIELLLVLAIIGIISAIAIPALLGQRARARDKSARGNASGVLADLIGQYDKVKDTGVSPVWASVIGTSTAQLVPQIFTATNPWATSGALTGFTTTAVAESNTNPGSTTAAAALVGNLGQVQLGYLAPAAGANGLFAAAVYLNTSFSVNGATTNVFSQTAGVD